MPMTTYLENALLEGTLRGNTFTAPANVWMSLYSTQNTPGTAGTELTGNGYARQQVTFSAAASGEITSNAAVTFTASGNNWPLAVSSAIMSANTAGNMLYYYNISPRTVNAGDSLVFATGDITITIG